MTGCAGAPAAIEDVVTSAPAAADGSASYYVYLLGTPEHSGDPVVNQGFAGIQCGIDYTPDTGSTDGIRIWNWTLCADLQFTGDNWPDPGTGNTITWDKDNNCQTGELASAGFFYLTAYAPSVMEIAPWPNSGLVKAANCAGAEVVLDEVLDVDGVGWLSLGGAARGLDSDGCNPALEPCSGPVAVEPVTWGKLKTTYR